MTGRLTVIHSGHWLDVAGNIWPSACGGPPVCGQLNVACRQDVAGCRRPAGCDILGLAGYCHIDVPVTGRLAGWLWPFNSL
jgi:hypothetical protein